MGDSWADDRQPPGYWFATCQVGAETTLKSEIARNWPGFHLAFSRPGYVTFRLPADHGFADDFDAETVFARVSGFSLGHFAATTDDELEAALRPLLTSGRYQALHVFERDSATPGYRGYEPGLTPAAVEHCDAIRRLLARPSAQPLMLPVIAQPGQLVLDCVLVDPGQWWIGCHRAGAGPSCYPGGFSPIKVPDNAVSRAYGKIEEAIASFDWPLAAGDLAAEIGCAPGGSSQALLARGLTVLGVDPATVDASVLAHSNFRHLQMRGAAVKRREFRGVRWLLADINVAPSYTLETIEAIVTHPTISIEGLILTLKLLEWSLATELPEYLERIRRWGYPDVRARQLAGNRQEVTVVAMRPRAARQTKPRARKRRSR